MRESPASSGYFALVISFYNQRARSLTQGGRVVLHSTYLPHYLCRLLFMGSLAMAYHSDADEEDEKDVEI